MVFHALWYSIIFAAPESVMDELSNLIVHSAAVAFVVSTFLGTSSFSGNS